MDPKIILLADIKGAMGSADWMAAVSARKDAVRSISVRSAITAIFRIPRSLALHVTSRTRRA